MKAIDKYLAGWAEEESRAAAKLPYSGHVLVIPSFAEGDGVLATLDSVPTGTRGDVLTILVVNEPVRASTEQMESNRRTLEALEKRYGSGTPISGFAHLRLREHPRGWLVTIDRRGARALPEQQGVGLARKIGFDLAFAVAVQGKGPIAYLHGTDADVVLPEDYFAAADRPNDDADTLIHPFVHRVEADVGGAIWAYEASLRYYVLGLRYAGSRYAFHTIGSLISMTPYAYAAVRGVPRRSGAEDFYLLNKLRKVGAVHSLGSKPVVLSGRASMRVPFGTGPAIARIMNDAEASRNLPVYHPAAFDHLREALVKQPELDAFQTLKLVHALRDSRYPNLGLHEALALAPFFQGTPEDDLASVCIAMAALERG